MDYQLSAFSKQITFSALKCTYWHKAVRTLIATCSSQIGILGVLESVQEYAEQISKSILKEKTVLGNSHHSPASVPQWCVSFHVGTWIKRVGCSLSGLQRLNIQCLPPPLKWNDCHIGARSLSNLVSLEVFVAVPVSRMLFPSPPLRFSAKRCLFNPLSPGGSNLCSDAWVSMPMPR